ncbi:MAG: hypothetical protein Q9163_003220 [Psora crenata]
MVCTFKATFMEDISGLHLRPPQLAQNLKQVFQYLNTNPSPHVPNPPTCQKRASVALVIRVRPASKHQASWDVQKCSSPTRPVEECLDCFFDQDWVKNGDAEVLFIKRAARVGDRWTSHVALPGGKREPNDKDDSAVSVRETWEETGLALNKDYCLPPTEVQSAHWVSLVSLLSPSLRTYEHADFTDRTYRLRSPATKLLIRAFFGQMTFSAVRLKPSESIFCNATPTASSAGDKPALSVTRILQAFPSYFPSTGSPLSHERPMLLWGLTLGIITDLLENLDSKATAGLWSWPTFTHPDIRFCVWLLTRNFRSRRLRELKTSGDSDSNCNNAQVGGIDSNTFTVSMLGRGKSAQIGVAGAHLLDGYFEQMKTALLLALGMRLSVAIPVISMLVRKLGRHAGALGFNLHL